MRQRFQQTFAFHRAEREQATQEAQQAILADFENALRYGFTADGSDYYDGMTRPWVFGAFKNPKILHIQTELIEDVGFHPTQTNILRMDVFFEPRAMNLTPEEQAWIETNPERCTACGHLDIFHSQEADFGDIECNVDFCACVNHQIRTAGRWHRVPMPEPLRTELTKHITPENP